jgi:excisionase family DNA binding protein
VLQESVFEKARSPCEGQAPSSAVLTVREVAAILRVSTFTVYAMVERGEVEHVRVSNAIRIVISRRGSLQELSSKGST